MTKALLLATSLSLVLAASAHAQASKAQLDREHDRAVAAGDWENDPYDPRSSNALNRAQVEGYVSPPRDAAGGYGQGGYVQGGYVQGAAPGMASGDASYSSDMTYSDSGYVPPPAPRDDTIIIQGELPANSPSSFGQPDTNPQSSGTPMTNQVYVYPATVPPPPDDDSTGF